MSTPSISPIQPIDPSASTYRSAPVPTGVSEEAAARAAQGAGPAAEAQPQPAAAQSPAEKIKLSDVRLKFVMNEETKEMTIYVLDRASHEVLRTIPPDDFKKLNAGDLLELFA